MTEFPQKKYNKILHLQCGCCEKRIKIHFSVSNSTHYYYHLKFPLLNLSKSISIEEIDLLEELIKNQKWSAITSLFSEFNGIICSKCGIPYCIECWTKAKIQREDDFDMYSTAICPNGHNNVINQIL